MSAKDTDWISHVLELLLSNALELGLNLSLGVSMDVLGKADPTRLSQTFQACCDVHPIAVDIVVFDNHISQVDSYAKPQSRSCAQSRPNGPAPKWSVVPLTADV